jgi:hypothetical protein
VSRTPAPGWLRRPAGQERPDQLGLQGHLTGPLQVGVAVAVAVLRGDDDAGQRREGSGSGPGWPRCRQRQSGRGRPAAPCLVRNGRARPRTACGSRDSRRSMVEITRCRRDSKNNAARCYQCNKHKNDSPEANNHHEEDNRTNKFCDRSVHICQPPGYLLHLKDDSLFECFGDNLWPRAGVDPGTTLDVTWRKDSACLKIRGGLL